MAGSVIQATGMVEFEDGLWIGNHLKARNGLQRVHSIPEVQPGVVRTPGSSRGRLNSNLPGSAWLLGVLSQAPGSIPGSRGVRIDPA